MSTTKKLYSKKSISIATFIGGPLAASILIGQNFRALGKHQLYTNSIFIGLISTVALIGLLTLTPEYIIDKIPQPIIPAIYTGIIFLIINKYQGIDIEEHEKLKGEFQSPWKAAGIALVSSLILIGGIFSSVFFSPTEFDYELYDKHIEEFVQNESEAFKLYEIYEQSNKDEITQFIDEIAIPKWHENINIINKISAISNLPEELKSKNKALIKYSNLQLKSLGLIRMKVQEDTHKYDDRINAIADEIDLILENI